jgi:hypothetical protein
MATNNLIWLARIVLWSLHAHAKSGSAGWEVNIGINCCQVALYMDQQSNSSQRARWAYLCSCSLKFIIYTVSNYRIKLDISSYVHEWSWMKQETYYTIDGAPKSHWYVVTCSLHCYWCFDVNAGCGASFASKCNIVVHSRLCRKNNLQAESTSWRKGSSHLMFIYI